MTIKRGRHSALICALERNEKYVTVKKPSLPEAFGLTQFTYSSIQVYVHFHLTASEQNLTDKAHLWTAFKSFENGRLKLEQYGLQGVVFGFEQGFIRCQI